MKAIIWYAIALHFIRAIFLITSPTPLPVGSLSVFYVIFPNPHVGGFLMLSSTILAMLGVTLFFNNQFRSLFFMPQFLFLLITAGSTINYILAGRAFNGVTQPWSVILLDQLPYLILVASYTSMVLGGKRET